MRADKSIRIKLSVALDERIAKINQFFFYQSRIYRERFKLGFIVVLRVLGDLLLSLSRGFTLMNLEVFQT